MIEAENEWRFREALMGVLLGTAIGDSLGLPAEGLSRARIERRWKGEWRQRLLFGRGMCSDDTEHTFFVAQALLAHPDDPRAFQNCLAWKLRFWLAGLPAGIGFATLRAALKLWLGFPVSRSGVYSAGNGPAMRSALIGAYFFDEPVKRRAFVAASTRLTHTDPKAETAALAVAEAAAWIVRRDMPIEEWLDGLHKLGNDSEWSFLCKSISAGRASNQSVDSLAQLLGLGQGVTGYAYHSVPIALYAWLRSRLDFRSALESALNCGGDTDTVGAITGALAGASAGRAAFPTEWLEMVWEWPRSMRVLEKIGCRLAEQKFRNRPVGAVRYCWPGILLRNIVFMVVILAHALRRLGPPY